MGGEITNKSKKKFKPQGMNWILWTSYVNIMNFCTSFMGYIKNICCFAFFLFTFLECSIRLTTITRHRFNFFFVSFSNLFKIDFYDHTSDTWFSLMLINVALNAPSKLNMWMFSASVDILQKNFSHQFEKQKL